MKDSQRQVMYDGWARGKKWMRVEVYKSFTSHDDSINKWRACAEHTFGCVERPTKHTAIAAIQGKLVERGYEISNMAELMGIEEPKRMTFLEWCKEVKYQIAKRNADNYPSPLYGTKKFKMKKPFVEWLRFIEAERKTKILRKTNCFTLDELKEFYLDTKYSCIVRDPLYNYPPL